MLRIFLSATFLVLTPVSLFAQENSRAREIFEEVDQRRNKITYETADMDMVIYDSKGRTRNREMKSFSFAEGDIEKSLLVFEAPANVRGTAFLTLSEGPDEVQKLYLPALSKIQTITASEKGDRFMGSDFTYEDLGDQDPDDYTFELVSENDVQAVLKAEKKEKSQYSWIRFHIYTDRYILYKAEYFNEEGEMIKRLETEDYTNVYEDVWRAGKMTMFDLTENRCTELTWSSRVINDSIPEWRFTERGLRRGN